MAINWTSSRIGSVLPLIAIGLALANWNARPDAALAWAAVIVISVVMIAVQRLSQRALSRSPGDAAWVRGVGSVAGAVAIGASMIIIPLALSLAHAYGLVDDPDSGMRRTNMIMIGAYLAVIGNAMPRMLPPTSSMPCGGARSTGVSAPGWLDVGALRSWNGDGGAGAANRRADAHIVGTGSYGHDRDDRAAPAPSQAAATRSAPELTRSAILHDTH